MQGAVLEALKFIASWQALLFMVIGVFIGIVFGAIPGLSGGLAIVVLLPVTFTMDPFIAIVLLLGIYCGGQYGGAISSILIGVPGDTVAAATVYDGHPLAKKGYPQKSLSTALVASFIGGTIAAIILLVIAPFISKYAVKLGAPEYFAVSLLGLAIIAGVCGKSAFSGIISACIGMLLSTIGIDSISGSMRYTFGNMNLLQGLALMPVLLGAFAVNLIYKSIIEVSQNKIEVKVKSEQDDKYDKTCFKRTGVTMLKGGIIGSGIGAIPGAGAAIAAFLSYSEAKRASKEPWKFGTGVIEGIAAPESANNAVAASSFIPLLTLGIPGSAVAATLQGALSMHGVVAGPMMMQTDGKMYYIIIIAFLIIQFFMLLEGKLLSNLFKKIVLIPKKLLMPILVIFCLAGAYIFKYRTFDVGAFIIIGTLFYILFKFGASAAPFVLGFVLGPTIEFNLAGALVIGKGSWLIFLKRPICLFFIVVSIVLYIVMYRQNKKCNQVIKEQLKEIAEEVGEEM